MKLFKLVSVEIIDPDKAPIVMHFTIGEETCALHSNEEDILSIVKTYFNHSNFKFNLLSVVDLSESQFLQLCKGQLADYLDSITTP